MDNRIEKLIQDGWEILVGPEVRANPYNGVTWRWRARCMDGCDEKGYGLREESGSGYASAKDCIEDMILKLK